MHLAQELVDYIIDLVQDDPTTLLRVSLVSRAWVGRTRAYLCESLKITHSKLSSSDPSCLAPLCGYVKILHFAWPRGTVDPSSILDCFEQSEPHTLAIHSCELHSLDGQTIRRYFAKFPCASITALELYDISPSCETFLILSSLFPNVDDLTISVNEWEDGPGSEYQEIIQHFPSPPLRGSFKFLDPPGHKTWSYFRGEILRVIAALPLQFQTVSLDYDEQCGVEISIILKSCSKTVKKVFIGRPQRKSWPRTSSAVPCSQCANS